MTPLKPKNEKEEFLKKALEGTLDDWDMWEEAPVDEEYETPFERKKND